MRELLMTVGQVASLAGVSREAVLQWENRGLISAARIGEPRGPAGGGSIRLFAASEVRQFLLTRKARAKRKSARKRQRREESA